MSAVLVARFIFELSGAPVGVVELHLDADTYSYRSTLAYRHREATREDRFSPAATPVPEGLWFLKRPALGCVDGVAEISHRKGTLCADSVDPREVKGTTFGNAFVARYDDAGSLIELTEGPSHFVRTSSPLHPGQPYASGFPITGKGAQLTLDPPLEGTRWPAQEPKGTRQTPAEDGTCLEAAQAFIDEAHADYRVVLGLVVDGGRAYPHAWARGKTHEVDPSAAAQEAPRVNHAYLELPKGQAGAVYVELLEGRRTLKWK